MSSLGSPPAPWCAVSTAWGTYIYICIYIYRDLQGAWPVSPGV